MYLNKVQLYGNLTRDPEIRAMPSGQQVANFGIATNRTFKDKSGKRQEQTEFHNLVAFGRTAEVIGQYLKKGRPVYVEGRIQTRSWDKDGAKQYRTEIVVENFQFGPSTGEKDTRDDFDGVDAPAATDEQITYPDEEVNPEDVPF